MAVTFKLFAAVFAFSYAILAGRAASKYGRNKELFSFTNAKLILMSVVLWYPLGLQVNILNKKATRMEFLLKNDVSSCNNLDSPMSYFSRLYD